MNLFIEGIPGTGKTTLLHKLEKIYPQDNFYYEGDYCPIELAWNAYLSFDQYQHIMNTFPSLKEEMTKHMVQEENHYILSYTKIKTDQVLFYQTCEAYEIYSGRKSKEEFTSIVYSRYHNLTDHNVFECAFFQNIIDELILYKEFTDEQILSFYEGLLHQINIQNIKIIRLIPKDIEKNIEIIRKERVNEKGEEVWYAAMNEYLKNSPYGKKHPTINCENYFKLRIGKENLVIQKLLNGHYEELESKNVKL